MIPREKPPGDGEEDRSAPVANEVESDTIRRPEEGRPETPASSFARVIRQASPYLAASWTLTVALFLLGFAGYWLDRKFETTPWLTMTGLLLGAAVGLFEVARVARVPRDGESIDDERR